MPLARPALPLLLLAAAAAGAAAAAAARALPAEEPAPAGPPSPPSLVLVVGDGTGWQQWGLLLAARRAAGETAPSAFERMAAAGVTGAITTFAADSLVADSAAGATALACGARCGNGGVGVDAEGRPARSLFEEAGERGQWTGAVTTTALPDATPAAFTAHAKSRRLLPAIAAEQSARRDLRVLLGGGTQFFVPRTAACSAAGPLGRGIADGPSRRGDDRDLVKEMRERGFAVATDRASLLAGPAPERLLGLFAPWNLPYAVDRDAPGEAEAPSLPEMTARALEVLAKGPKGFLLLVEAGRVDHACHHNDAGAALAEMAELDATLDLLLRFREGRRDLLLVLTADHETGGLSVSAPRGEMLTPGMLGLLRTQRGSLEAAAAEVGGAAPLPEAAREAVPWLPEKPVPLTDPAADGRGPFLGKHRRPYADAASGGAGVVFSTDGHTATPVPILALGPGAERLGGVRGNDEAGRILREILAGR